MGGGRRAPLDVPLSDLLRGAGDGLTWRANVLPPTPLQQSGGSRAGATDGGVVMAEVVLQPSAGLVVHLRGDLDLEGCERWVPQLRELAEQLGRGEDPAGRAPAGEATGAVLLRLDLEGVEFADCSCLRLLEDLRERAAGRLVLHRPSAAVRRLLELASPHGAFAVEQRPAAPTTTPDHRPDEDPSADGSTDGHGGEAPAPAGG